MIAWIILIILVLAALIVFVNSKDPKQGEKERTNNYFGLYDLRRPEQEAQEQQDEPKKDP